MSKTTRNTMITLATLVLAAACGQDVSHNGWTNPEFPEAPQLETDPSLGGEFAHANLPPATPTLEAPEAVKSLELIEMTALTTDPEGDAFSYQWKIRGTWLEEGEDLLAEGTGETFSFEAPVPPGVQDVEVEIYARDVHGRRSPSRFQTVSVDPRVLTPVDFELFELVNLCVLTDCQLEPVITAEELKVELPQPDEFIEDYVGVIKDIDYDNFTAQVDFQPDMAAVTAGTQLFNPALNAIVASDENGGGYSFTLYAYEVSFTPIGGGPTKTSVAWKWELAELASDALVEGPNQLSADVVDHGFLGSLPASNQIAVELVDGQLTVTVNGAEQVTVDAVHAAGTHFGFGANGTAASFNNVSATLLP